MGIKWEKMSVPDVITLLKHIYFYIIRAIIILLVKVNVNS